MSATETRRKAVEGARTGRGLSSRVMLRSIPHVLSERGIEVLLVALGGMVGVLPPFPIGHSSDALLGGRVQLGS